MDDTAGPGIFFHVVLKNTNIPLLMKNRYIISSQNICPNTADVP